MISTMTPKSGYAMLDPDTVISPKSLQAARRAGLPVKKVSGGDLDLLAPEDEATPPVSTSLSKSEGAASHPASKETDKDAVYPSSRDIYR